MGHPDKVSDQISDAILDAILAEQAKVKPENLGSTRVAVETLCTTGQVVIAGEVRTDAYVDAAQIARNTIREIGYTDPGLCFDFNCGVLTAIHSQSADIARGVDHAVESDQETGAGDQGLMFGYATRETDTLMPMPIHLAHRIVEKLAELRRSGKLAWLRPDGKSQVTIAYENERPVAVHTVVVSTQHDESVLDKNDEFSKKAKQQIIDEVIKPCILKDSKTKKLWNDDIIFHINPTGKFVIGGPPAATGLTGRKISVAAYGGSGAGCRGAVGGTA